MIKKTLMKNIKICLKLKIELQLYKEEGKYKKDNLDKVVFYTFLNYFYHKIIH